MSPTTRIVGGVRTTFPDGDPADEIRCRPVGSHLLRFGVTARGRWWSRVQPLPACSAGESPYVLPGPELDR